MFPQTLYPQTRQVLDRLVQNGVLADFGFYLAGGTGLALQLGHRKSIDLDFFTPDFPKRDLLLTRIRPLQPTVIQEAIGTLDTQIAAVKVSFLEYRYPQLRPFVPFAGTQVGSVADIGAMKLSAVSSRGSKKDLIDLYYLLKTHSLKEQLGWFEKKFAGVQYQRIHLLKSFVFFDDADREPDPDMAEEVDWETVKTSLEGEVTRYLREKQT